MNRPAQREELVHPKNIILVSVLVSKLVASGILGVGLTQDRDDLPFYSIDEAYLQVLSAYIAKRFEIAIPALKFTPEKENNEADRVLAIIYSDVTSFEYNNLKAFEYLERYAYYHSEVDYSHRYANYVAEVFLSLGKYYLSGIPDSRIK